MLTNEYVEDVIVKIIFVKSADNDTEILGKHVRKMVVEKPLRFLLALKIFEVKRKGVRCDVLT